MPNWKKIALSGSNPEFASLTVDNSVSAGSLNVDTSVSASSITSTSGSVDNLTANDKLQLGGAGSQFFAYNEDTVKVKFANWYSSNDRQYGMGQLWFETWFAAIDNNANPALRDERRIGFYLEEPDAGASDADGGGGAHPSNARFYVDIDGAYLSGSLQATGGITGSAFTGSFTGDGSGLSNVSATVTEQVTVIDTFTSVTSSTVTHTFDTKNVIVQVYDNSDNLVIPQSITTSTTSSVDIVFDSITSGRVIVAKGGHIVSGSITTTIASSSTVSDTFTAQTSYTASHTFGTSDVFVQVYDNTDSLILPQKVKILTTGSIGLDFDTATTGKVIIGKSGHIVSGSAPASTVTFSNVTDKPALISSSAQIATDISGSFTSTSASIASDIANISTDFGSITNNPFTASGNQITASGHIIPSANDTYDLGSTTKQWRDLFLSSGSLYIDGTKIVSSDATTLTFTTDTGQSIKLLETGADDIILQTDSGNIELKGTVEILTGKKITDSAGTKVLFGDSIGITGSIDLTGTVDGIDLQAFSSSVATGLASSTADYTQLTNVPSGIISSSTQIASDISGSFTAASASISTRLTTEETNVDNLQSFSSSLSSTIITYTGSFSGDGSSLTGITAAGTLSSSAQIASDISGSLSVTAIAALESGILSGSAQITSLTSYTETFTGSAAVTASHNLGTKNVNVQCYGSDDFQFFPSSIKTHDTNNVYVTFNSSRTGRIIITK